MKGWMFFCMKYLLDSKKENTSHLRSTLIFGARFRFPPPSSHHMLYTCSKKRNDEEEDMGKGGGGGGEKFVQVGLLVVPVLSRYTAKNFCMMRYFK